MSFDRITLDPAIIGGHACIRGMRIPVSVVLSQVAYGASVEEILEGYPDLKAADIWQALQYAAWLVQEEPPCSPEASRLNGLTPEAYHLATGEWNRLTAAWTTFRATARSSPTRTPG